MEIYKIFSEKRVHTDAVMTDHKYIPTEIQTQFVYYIVYDIMHAC